MIKVVSREPLEELVWTTRTTKHCKPSCNTAKPNTIVIKFSSMTLSNGTWMSNNYTEEESDWPTRFNIKSYSRTKLIVHQNQTSGMFPTYWFLGLFTSLLLACHIFWTWSQHTLNTSKDSPTVACFSLMEWTFENPGSTALPIQPQGEV